VPALQGGHQSTENKQIIATCKHFAAYDVETNRFAQNYNVCKHRFPAADMIRFVNLRQPTQQDLSEYYLAPFKTCVRDAHAGSVMCSYNSVNGIPACANEYLLNDILRKEWGFTKPYHFVVSDCDAVEHVYDAHNFTDSMAAAAAVALNAGTDSECGSAYRQLNISVANNWTTEAQMDTSLTRLYNALFTVGWFDGQPEFDSK
jgi:beta-D-xylosidase 4